MKNLDKGRAAALACEGGFEALQSMLKGEYTEESTGARTIRQTGGKDRHSKVFTARGPRDRRVRLSVATAIRFYDLQDRLGFEQPSKAVEWLLLNCQPSIQGLPQLASLHPVRVASALSQPAAYVAHNHNKGQEPCKHEHNNTHHQKEEILDAVMHPNGEQNFHHFNYSTHHPYSLHNGLFPLSSDDPLQDAIEEDLSQYSNPSSSGGSSDHPISFSEGARPQSRVTLAEAIPITANHTASSASIHGQCSTSFVPSPDQPTNIHMNKRHRSMQQCMQNQEGGARFASNGSMIGKSLGINNELSSQLSCSTFGDPPSFNRLMNINDEDAFLMSKFSLQISQLQNDEDMQQVMKLANYKPSQYVDIAQQLFAAQASQLADNMLIQGAANESNREAEYMKGQVCTSNTSNMNDNMQLYNKMAFQVQVDELACSNLYASPSPSESTSINPLAAAYSKAGGSNNTNNNMVDDQKLAAAANILFRPSWNPASGLQ